MLVIKRLFNLSRIIISVLFNFKLTGPVRLRIFFERAGGAFIKLGQILALRQDFLSFSYIGELLKLLSKNPETGFIQMQIVFIQEMGKPVGEFFSEFKEKPVASGSIAQVYFARLHDGSEVAVKIQHPGTKEAFEADFLLICFFSGLFDFFRLFLAIRAGEVASEFVSWTRRELDFIYEARNADALYEHSKKHPQTVIPKQYLELTTPRVLIQEFIKDGVPVEDILFKNIDREKLLEKNINPDELAVYLIKDEMRQYFIDGFFHADPHPANLIFLPENKLVYLDFGIVGEAKDDRLLFLKSLYGIAKKDIDFLSRHFFEFGQKEFSDEIDIFLQADLPRRQATKKILEKLKELIIDNFKKEIEKITRPLYEKNAKSAAIVFLKIIKKAEEYGGSIPREAVLFFRTLSILEMVALQISPSFDMIKALNLFFLEYPLDKVEELIKEGVHEEESGEKIIPLTDVDWEFFKEISAIEKEKKLMARERMTEMIFYYAEKYEEIRSLIKNI
jgi:predicted unusual protein kinase regulating ubiquinone biosynthesis (AarF/ABC1/UbiB family)